MTDMIDQGQRYKRASGLTACFGGLVAGHIGWRIARTRPTDISIRYAEIEHFHINEAFSGQELAAELIAGFFNDCRRKAICLTRVGAGLDQAAISILEGFGFVESRGGLTRCTRPHGKLPPAALWPDLSLLINTGGNVNCHSVHTQAAENGASRRREFR